MQKVEDEILAFTFFGRLHKRGRTDPDHKQY